MGLCNDCGWDRWGCGCREAAIDEGAGQGEVANHRPMDRLPGVDVPFGWDRLELGSDVLDSEGRVIDRSWLPGEELAAVVATEALVARRERLRGRVMASPVMGYGNWSEYVRRWWDWAERQGLAW